MELPEFLGQTPNRKELSLVRKYPKEAAKVYKCSQEAIAMTILFYGESGQDDNSDAFRHCLWNALMRKEVGKSNYLSLVDRTASGELRPVCEGMLADYYISIDGDFIYRRIDALDIGETLFHKTGLEARSAKGAGSHPSIAGEDDLMYRGLGDNRSGSNGCII